MNYCTKHNARYAGMQCSFCAVGWDRRKEWDRRQAELRQQRKPGPFAPRRWQKAIVPTVNMASVGRYPNQQEEPPCS